MIKQQLKQAIPALLCVVALGVGYRYVGPHMATADAGTSALQAPAPAGPELLAQALPPRVLLAQAAAVAPSAEPGAEPPAAEPPPARPELPDPLDEPLSWWDGVRDLRRTGGFWAALALAGAAIMAAAHRRAAPKDGEAPPAPGSWRARSIALFFGLSAVLGATGDALLGMGNWAALVTVVVSSASLVWRALNPSKGDLAKPVAQEGGAA